jgi:hypothetical protein
MENLTFNCHRIRPQILVLTGNPPFRPPLVDFAYCIAKGIGLIVCGHVVSVNQLLLIVYKLNNFFNEPFILGTDITKSSKFSHSGVKLLAP